MNKPMETYRSGAMTPFNDAAGIVIRVHDYIKDEDGNRYNVNTYLQAVPEGEAPAVELKELMKTKKVYVMDAKEVLQVKKPAETNRRGGRRHRKSEKPAEEAKPESEHEGAGEESADAEGKEHDAVDPVSTEMLLMALSDEVLARELRRRGYMLCAVRPAFIQL